VYQSSVYQLSVSLTTLLNWHLLTMHSTYQLRSKYLPLGKNLRTHPLLLTDTSTATYGHIHRYLRTHPPLLTDTSTATYGHIHRYLRTYPPLLTDTSTATYRHIHRYLPTYSPLLTDISSYPPLLTDTSTATYGYIHSYIRTYPPLLTDLSTFHSYFRTYPPLLMDTLMRRLKELEGYFTNSGYPTKMVTGIIDDAVKRPRNLARTKRSRRTFHPFR
jgi:hypothetical protein